MTSKLQERIRTQQIKKDLPCLTKNELYKKYMNLWGVKIGVIYKHIRKVEK